jgi:hypothetical protein
VAKSASVTLNRGLDARLGGAGLGAQVAFCI